MRNRNRKVRARKSQSQRRHRLRLSKRQLQGELQPLQIETLEPRILLSGSGEAEIVNIAVEHIRDHAADVGLVSQDLTNFNVTDQYATEHLGVTHVYLQQTHNRLNIADAVMLSLIHI